MTREHLSARAFAALANGLSDRDRAIVIDVLACKLLSARHIERLHFDTSLHATPATATRTCRRVLERLVRDRLLVRLHQRTVGGLRAGSASYIYAPGPRAHRLVPGTRRQRFREPTATYVDHTLSIADLVVTLRRTAASGRVELLELQTEPDCWRQIGGGSQRVLRPDLFVALAIDDYEYHSFVEVDLGTEGLPRLLGKCALYQRAFEAGDEQRARGLFPRAVWLLDDPERAERLRQAIRRRQLASDLFVVAILDAPMPALTEGALNAADGMSA